MNNCFKPAWWLPNPHLQTLWAALVRRKIQIPIRWERLELADGDFLDLSWVGRDEGPIVIVLHGLNGSIDSSYVRGILQAIKLQGWRGVLMHFRGCSGVPNRLARSYHSGDTNDLQYLIAELIKREPKTPLYAVGYSLGGNVLLKWLGESGINNPLRAAAAISIPFEVGKTSDYLNTGFSRLYQWRLLRELLKVHQRKFTKMVSHPDRQVKNIQSIREFDDTITAPLHGFKNAEDYYTQSSSRQYLANIKIPTLVLHALDDPFTPLNSIPNIHEVSSNVTLELTKQGGHVGFVAGKYLWRPAYWLEEKIVRYIESQENREV
jgi:predicted alpha/beta-fold hydrolase